MPDASRTPHAPSWSEAFHALPLEAPDASSWPALAARLDAQSDTARTCARTAAVGDRSRTSRTPWALAAALGAIAIGLTFWRLHDRTGMRDVSEQFAQEPATSPGNPDGEPIARAANTPLQGLASTSRIDAGHSRPVSGPRMTAASDGRPSALSAAHAVRPALPRPMPVAATPVAIRDRVDRDHASPRSERTRQASAIASGPNGAALSGAALSGAALNGIGLSGIDLSGAHTRDQHLADGRAPASTPSDLERLYDLSAQLETLLAMARDPRVESGPAAVLSSELDAALTAIDARLSLPELATEDRVSLWQARVDTLQQAASFEGHLRLLAAQGQRLDGMLVDID